VGDNFAGFIVDRKPSFSVKLAEWNQEDRLPLVKRVQTTGGEVKAFSDPHSRSAKQQQPVGQEVRIFAEFAVQKAVVFGRKGFGKILIERREIVSDDKSPFERSVGPQIQIIEQTAQAKQIPHPGSTSVTSLLQAAQPAKDMRVAAQLGRFDDFGIAGVQIAQKIVYRCLVGVDGAGPQGNRQIFKLVGE
jgi:hypothetical protein